MMELYTPNTAPDHVGIAHYTAYAGVTLLLRVCYIIHRLIPFPTGHGKNIFDQRADLSHSWKVVHRLSDDEPCERYYQDILFNARRAL